MRGSRPVSDGHYDRERRTDGPASEPLVPINDPLVAFALGGGFKSRRIRARDFRFRHRKTGTYFTRREWAEIFLLLFVRCRDQQQLGIAGVGSRIPKETRCKNRSADNLIYQRLADVADSHAAPSDWKIRRPQT